MINGVSDMQALSVTVAAAAKMTGLGRTTIFELLKAGRLRSAKIGSRRLILVSSLHELLEQASNDAS
jgi:excisionase family DNA binding protein